LTLLEAPKLGPHAAIAVRIRENPDVSYNELFDIAPGVMLTQGRMVDIMRERVRAEETRASILRSEMRVSPLLPGSSPPGNNDVQTEHHGDSWASGHAEDFLDGIFLESGYDDNGRFDPQFQAQWGFQ